MANVPGTIWRKISSQFGAPPQWVQVGNFAMGIKGDKGDRGEQGSAGISIVGPAGPAGASSSVLRGYLDGFVLSNDSGTPNTLLDISGGHATDSTNTFLMSRLAIVKDCNAAWAAGNTFGGNFAAASLAISTWYHVFVIHKTSDGSIDAGIDTSLTAANIPSGYNAYRRIGSIKTDASAHIIAFHQYNDEFWWDTSVLDINVTAPGTTAVTRTLTTPTGVKNAAIVTTNCYSTTLNIQGYLSSLDSADLACAYSTAIETAAGDTTIEGLGTVRIWTNTSAQIRSRLSQSDANTVLKIRTLGWVDQRGRDS